VHKKVLIVTYYWPPAGGPGVQRWLKFVKYLPSYGIEPIVYIPENPNYPILDESLLTEIPDTITTVKHPIKEPYKKARLFSKSHSKTISKGIIHMPKNQSLVEKLLLFIRGNFFIPDARKNWVKPSVTFLSDYLIAHDIDAIITTGPPHSLHLIGLQLRQDLGLRWIADFRDPWTTIGYHKKLKLTSLAKSKHKVLESKVLQAADTIIVTSNTTKTEFKAITNKPITVITNGYDVEQIPEVTLDRTFTLSHIGSLLSERNPEVLWRVLSDLVVEHTTFKNDFKLKLIGAVSIEVLNAIEKHKLSTFLSHTPYVSHNEALKLQREAQVLLLVEINSEETKCIIPGKLFEYMAAERPIIGIGPKGSDIAQILATTNTGRYFNYSDYISLKATILEYYEAFKSSKLETHPIGLQQYSRKALTKKLAKAILQ